MTIIIFSTKKTQVSKFNVATTDIRKRYTSLNARDSGTSSYALSI